MTDRPVQTFLLVPDAGAARRARRLLAERGASSGVVVGTFPELLERARRACLVPEPSEDREAAFAAVLAGLEDAFWSGSLAVAPEETATAVRSALIALLSATDPYGGSNGLESGQLPDRPRRHVADLLRLAAALAGRLPGEPGLILDLLQAAREEALNAIRVLCVEGVPALTHWQEALVEKLNGTAGADPAAGAPDPVLDGILREVLAPANGTGPGALGLLQSRLFSAGGARAEPDRSVQWIGVRDFLQEAEVAAGMAQAMLAEEPSFRPADIGLLVPDSFEYSVAVEDAFRLGGLALSGLPAERWRRDLGREAVFHFLYCRQKPAPAMALAVCLGSPLMPWSRETGARLAQAVMDGDYRLLSPQEADRPAREMLDLLREDDSVPATLAEALEAFAALLRGGEELADHLEQARAAVAALRATLGTAAEIDWAALRRAVTPGFLATGEAPDFNLEGVTVWRESQEPWRPVRRLIVLGFAQGRYPSTGGSDPVFAAGDIEAIRERTGLPLEPPAEALARRRLRFRRQLGAVTGSVTFLVPRRDPVGDALAPSESLVFMHQLFAGVETPGELIIELDAAGERELARHLAVAAPAPPSPPRSILVEDLRFGRDLLALRTDREGGLKPESPSSLETLMVSQLAWLLRRLGAEPLLWAPESTDALLLGTLAHAVFEGLFRPDAPLPAREAIPGRVERLLEEVARRLAPFLRAPRWQVERSHFLAETIRAAQDWREVLVGLGAEILASEAWLQGTWSGIPIHGQTDLVLGLPGNRLLVVDYKRSKSKSRLPRMEKGYDSQASLYRAMLESGGPKAEESGALAERLRAGAATGIVYYMLNDQACLSDTLLPEAGSIPGWRTLDNDVAEAAMALIRRRLEEVRAGELWLNREGDAEFFEKEAGITPYALEASPLVGLFILPGDAVEAQ